MLHSSTLLLCVFGMTLTCTHIMLCQRTKFVNIVMDHTHWSFKYGEIRSIIAWVQPQLDGYNTCLESFPHLWSLFDTWLSKPKMPNCLPVGLLISPLRVLFNLVLDNHHHKTFVSAYDHDIWVGQGWTILMSYAKYMERVCFMNLTQELNNKT